MHVEYDNKQYSVQRFEDSCFIELDDDQYFEKNLDDCKDLGMELWVPGRYIALRKLKVNCNGHKTK